MKRKVCCFTESFELGGIESLITSILSRLDTEEFEVDVVSAKFSENKYSKTLRALGVNFIELSGKLRSPENFSLFKRLLKEKKYDVAHFNIFHGLALKYVKIAKNEGIDVRIVHAHGAGLRKSKLRFLKLFLHRFCSSIYKNAPTHRIACSENAAKFLYGDIPAQIIKNGIRTEEFKFSDEARHNMRKSLGFFDEILITHIGRMSDEKNHTFVLDTFKLYHNINRNSYLALAGDGPLREEYESYAKKLNIYERVKFLGNINNAPDLLSASDVFIFPSIVEGLGIAAVEAQASGLFTICSEALPREAKITDRFISLPITDASIWAEKISNLPSADKRESYAEVVKNSGFDISDTANEVSKLYRGNEL